jgi:hypothetical protein
MKYFQYLDLDWKPVSDKLKQFVLDNKELLGYELGGWKSVPAINYSYLIPDIAKMLEPLDVLPVSISFHISYSTDGTIHKDASMHECRRILLPVMNCENTTTKFYKSQKEPTLRYQSNGLPGYFGDIELEDCDLVAEYQLNRAITMRPKELHAVYSSNDSFPRISCPIAVNKDLTHLLI